MEKGTRKDRKHHLRLVRNKTSRRLDYILLGVILLVAAVLRLWKLGQVPFMHDEFSALFRLKFDSFRDLIQYGIKIDGHPAGVQTFLYYWAMVVGWDEFWLKLPFALMGIGSVFLIYVIGQQWFNRKVGLLAAAFFAVSQLTVFYSQIIRPYSPGLFFVLLMTYFWNKILFGQKKPSIGICIGFAISTCLSALAHNFSAAQAGLIFLTGLFFLKKERRLAYWLSGIGALVLYSPNLPIFYHQTFVNGGIGGWLARPKSTFLVDFLQYTMNYAPLFIFTVGVIIVLPFILQKPEKRQRPIRWAAIAWFVINFAVAYVYSLVREPIIQYSTLIFCYPFLIVMAFSFHRNNSMTMTQTTIAVAAILFIGATSLITNRRHYDLMYHQGYDQIAARMQQDNDSLTDIRFATATLRAELPDFYQSQTSVTRRIIFDEENHSPAHLRQWLDADHSHFLGFGWTDYVNPAWETQAVAHYPWLVQQNTWFTSKYLTLSSDSVAGATYQLQPLNTQRQSLVNVEWCTPQTIYGDSLDSKTNLVGVIATLQVDDTVTGCIVVMEVHDAVTDSLLFWHGGDDGEVLLPGTNRIVNAIRFDENDFSIQGKNIKTYLWNRNRGTIVAERFDYYCTQHDPRLAGLYEPL
ncbi:MAG: glycosyltransferase family 39 protein [Bacteroidales bacterium]|nr:glycosyltransferase family 39 protein [Bacteroidales bacterium]